MSTPDIVVSCIISTGTGPLQLENESAGYVLERSSLEEFRTSWRKHEVNNDWVEGSYVIGAVKENVTEPLAVYVTGDTVAQFRSRLNLLTAALDQLQYTVVVLEGGVSETWRCSMADYTVRTSQELRLAKMGLVTAQVPRKPTKVLA